MKIAKTKLILCAGAVLLAAGSTRADVVVAGWEKGLNTGVGLAPTQTLTDFSGNSAVSVNGGAAVWGQEWNRPDNDETFGSIVGGATFDGNSEGVYTLPGDVDQISATLSYTVVNNSATASYDLSYVSFDAWQAYGPAPYAYTVSSVAGDISLVNGIGSGNTTKISGIPDTTANGGSDYEDLDISLAGLTDRTLAPGESATFEVVFTGVTAGRLYVDNVAIVAIPEPASIGLIVLASASLLAIRRIRM